MSLLPPNNIQLYLPIFFRIWEAFNSTQLDERMLDISASLVQECVCAELESSSGSIWRDVGIFTTEQWAKICRTALVSMRTYLPLACTLMNDIPCFLEVPVGADGHSVSLLITYDILHRSSSVVEYRYHGWAR